MLAVLQILCNFLCRKTRPNKEGKCPIVLRIQYRKERRDIYTGLYCSPNHWDAAHDQVTKAEPAAQSINKNLQAMQYAALLSFEQMKFSGNEFTIDELVAKIKGEEETPLLIDYLKRKNEGLKRRLKVDISYRTFQKYERNLLYLLEFLNQEYKAQNFPLLKINQRFLEKYFQFLRADKNHSNNTAVKNMIALKAALKEAMQNGAIKTNPFGRTEVRR